MLGPSTTGGWKKTSDYLVEALTLDRWPAGDSA
jgi:hypothetical protein